MVLILLLKFDLVEYEFHVENIKSVKKTDSPLSRRKSNFISTGQKVKITTVVS